MKMTKKLIGLLFALAMALCMCISAFATEGGSDYSISITNNKKNVSIGGNKYYAYKLFDVEYNEAKTAYKYTISEKFKDFSYTVDGKTYSGESLVDYVAAQESNADALNNLANAAAKHAAADREATASGETATINLTEPGYYIVAGTGKAKDGDAVVTASCALTTTDPKANVIVKIDAPSVDKDIDGDKDTDDDTEGKVKTNNAAIGDKVPYVVTSTVPDMTGYNKYYFIVNDTLSKGLTFNKDVKVMLDGEDVTANCTITHPVENGETKLKIVFNNFLQYKKKTGKEIEITYSATVNEDAVINGDGNKNKVNLEFSNNPSQNPKGDNEPGDDDDDVTGKTPDKETTTYVTEVNLEKVDGDKKALAGAKFKIEGTKLNIVKVTGENFVEDTAGTYYLLKDGTYTETEATDKTKDSYEDTNKKYKLVTTQSYETQGTTPVTAEAFVDAQGKLKFTGLSAGEYDITELVAPKGYNKLTKPIKLKVEFANGTFTYKWDGEIGTDTYQVVNQSGSKLPETGGIGTTIFYVLGSLLAIGAAILLVVRKRMNMR